MPMSKETPMKENGMIRPGPGLMSLSSSGSGSGSSSSSRARVNKGEEVGEASFRVYYGATGAAVPFIWESQPGTPKHPTFDKSNDNIVPPLTPPPSYTSSFSSPSSRKTRKPWIFSTLFSSISRRRSMSHVTPTSSLSSSSSSYSGHIRSWSISSSSSSASLSTPNLAGRKNHFYHKRSASSFCFSGHHSFLLGDDNKSGSRSPPSSMCFGFTKKQGCYSMEEVKNAILSM